MEKINMLSSKFVKFGKFFFGSRSRSRSRLRFSLAPLALAVLFVGGGGTVWGQAQRYLSIGDDPSDPILDPFLIDHAWYADNYIGGAIWDAKLPSQGIVGTPNECNLQQVHIGDASSCTTSVSQVAGIAYFQRITHESGYINISATGRLYYDSIVSNTKISTASVARATKVTANSNVYEHTSVPKRYGRSVGGRTGNVELSGKPYFPDISGISFTGAGGLSLATSGVNQQNKTINLDPGTYYYSSIEVKGGFKIGIKPGRTIIYVKGDITDDANSNEIRFVDAGGSALSAKDLCDSTVMNNYDLLIIVGGSVTLNSGSTTLAGTIIAPNGTISTGAGAIKYDGQILANNLRFSNSYNALTNMRFMPLNLSAQAEAKDTLLLEDEKWNEDTPPSYNDNYNWSYNKNKDYTARIPIRVTFPAGSPANGTVVAQYSIGSNPPAGILSNSLGLVVSDAANNAHNRNGANRVRAIVSDANSSRLTFTNTSGGNNTITQYIDIRIIDNGVVDTDVTFALSLSKVSGDVNVPTVPINVTIKSDDPVLQKPVVNPATLSVGEYYANNGKSGWFFGGGNATTFRRGDKFGEVSVTRAPYSSQVSLTLGGANASWFEIHNIRNGTNRTTLADIHTSSAYAADYEALQSVALTVTASDGLGVPDGNGQGTGAVTINILPYNDLEFTVAPKAKSITESLNPQTLTFTTGDFDFSGDDSPSDKNFRRVVGGATHTVPAGKHASLSYNVTLRDSASYGYATDHFERSVSVPISVNRANLYAPVIPQNVAPVSVASENGSATIAITHLGTIRDDDNVTGSPANHYQVRFAGTPTSVLKQKAAPLGNAHISVTINAQGQVVYNLSAVPESYEFDNGKFEDTILVKIQNTDGLHTTSDVRIPVKITAKNDNAPTANNLTENIVKRGSVNPTTHTITRSLFTFRDADLAPVPFTADNIVISNDFTQPTGYLSTPSATNLVTVALDDTKKTFIVTIPPGYNVTTNGNTLTFKYKVVDEPTYYNPAKEPPKSSGEYTITLILDPGNADWVFPNDNYIIVDQGGTATALHNGKASVMWNIEKSESGLEAQSVKVETYPTEDVDDEFSLSSNGYFKYVHDGGDEISDIDYSDYFVYKAVALGASNEPITSEVPGNVFVFVNRTPDFGLEVEEQTVEVNANDVKKIVSVIGAGDRSKAQGAVLTLNKSVDLHIENGDLVAQVDFEDGDNISFKYAEDIEDTVYVTVTFALTESVNYAKWTYFNKSGTVDDNSYPTKSMENYVNDEEDNTATIRFKVVPNPKAEDYHMRVREEQTTETLLQGVVSYLDLTKDGTLKFLENVRSYYFRLEADVKYGKLTLDERSGRVEYKAEEYGIDESFTYWLVYELESGEKDSTLGTVTVSITQREPRVLNEPSYYYDDYDGKANGIIDRIVIPFDRDVDIMNTQFGITFRDNDQLSDFDVVAQNGYNKEVQPDGKCVVTLTLRENVVDDVATGGAVNVEIKYTNYDDVAPINVSVSDSAAPVVKSAQYVKALTERQSDTLIVEMSELSRISVGGGNLPFKFVRYETSELYDITLGAPLTIGDALYQYVISSADKGKIGEGDSIFVNVNPEEADPMIEGDELGEKVKQINPDNARRLIDQRQVTQMLSAVYFDTDEVKDGYIDLIKIDLGGNTKVNDDFAEKFAEEIVFSSTRDFTIQGGVKVNEGVISIPVKEAKDKPRNDPERKDPVTSVEDYDLVTLEKDVTVGLLTVKEGVIAVTDNVAPVILYGTLNLSSKETPNTTLDIVFSEPVVDLDKSGHPYDFKSVLDDRNYEMTLSKSESGGANTLRYKVSSITGVSYPLNNDSLRIIDGEFVSDVSVLGNVQNKTVWAPLKLNGNYGDSVDVHIVPQPFVLDADLPQSLKDYYKISDKNGVAIVLEARGPISDTTKQSGIVQILDQTGNAVTEKLEMKFVKIDSGERKDNVVGVVVWDGKNRNGRTVGISSYVALVEVNIKFDYGKDESGKDVVRTYSKSIRKVIGVKSSGSVNQ